VSSPAAPLNCSSKNRSDARVWPADINRLDSSSMEKHAV
jgi:hypothetical protein